MIFDLTFSFKSRGAGGVCLGVSCVYQSLNTLCVVLVLVTYCSCLFVFLFSLSFLLLLPLPLW